MLASLGRRIQRERAMRGLGLADLAIVSGVSVSMLSAVERGEKAPTIVVLGKIADGLSLPVASLLEEQSELVLIRRAGQQDVIQERGWQRTILNPVVPGVGFEWIRTVLPPGIDAGTYPGYAPGSHEYVTVHSGELTLRVDGRPYLLNVGDVAYFAADASHGYANTGLEPCVYEIAALTTRSRTPLARSKV